MSPFNPYLANIIVLARGYKTFFILHLADQEIYPAHYVKMPTIVGI